MTRRDAIRIAGFTGAAVIRSAAPQPSQQASGINYRPYCRCLPDALRGFASKALEVRKGQLQQLKTRTQIQQRQLWARETFWSIIGGKRERTLARVRTTGRLVRERYVVEKLVYEGRPGEWISANLYLPKTRSGPHPGVLFQAGHTKNGKAGSTYQFCCQGLVQLGFVVLTFDPIGQGERTNYPGANGLTRLSAADDEHSVPGRQLLLVGETMTRLQLEDAITSFDVLASHPQVDPQRLGAAGQSGGGTLTMMLAAVDDRLRAAVVSSGNTENVACADFHPPGSVDDAEQNFIGSGPLGFDRWDLLWPFAPRPLLVLSSAKDSFGTYSPNYVRNGREEYGRLKKIYGLLESPERIQYYESPLPHALSYVLRLELYRWLAKWLQTDDGPIDNEPHVAPDPDNELWAAPSGSVIRDFGSLSAFDVVRARTTQIQTPAITPDLRKLLAIASPANRQQLNVLAKVPAQGCEILAAEVCTAPGLWVPMWIFVPKGHATKLVIILDTNGRNDHWQEGDFYQTLAERAVVCVPDLRGFGDLRPEFSPGAADYASSHETDEAFAWTSLIFGRPLLGQRVQDLLETIDAIQKHFDLPLGLLAARGPATVPGICAAALDSRIEQVYLSAHLVSWRNITETEIYDYPFSNFVPNILAKTDLPYIAASIAPRRATLAGCSDAAGRRMTIEEVRRIYGTSNIKIRDQEEWCAQSLLPLL